MNVAVPLSQHPPILGHFASSHTVFSLCSDIKDFISLKLDVVLSFILSQSGFLIVLGLR